MIARDEVHRRIGELSDADLALAQLYLDYLRTGDSFLLAMLTAPTDDEPLTADEVAGMEEAWAEYRRGEVITADEAKRRLLG